VNAQERLSLLATADDELVLGWRNSEWTGIAPVLEEDVAFSSIAQNEIGHARALYQLLSDDADALAFDRAPDEYRCSPLVQLRFVPDWARTIARHVLYEAADELRIERLKASDDEAVAGLAAKIDREEVYHRLHAQMWAERLADEPRYRDAIEELWPYAVAMLEPDLREPYATLFGNVLPSNNLLQGLEPGSHVPDWPALWDEMTMVRRSVAGAAW
jgi:ring-1,2-phenylacetyl-CoA epoxidase subunit PaaC